MGILGLKYPIARSATLTNLLRLAAHGVSTCYLKHLTMNFFTRHKAFFDQPIRLEREEIAQPEAVMQAFCGAYHLHETRQRLWDLLETALTSENTPFQDAEARTNIMLFYNQLEELLEAVYIRSQSTQTSHQSSGCHDGRMSKIPKAQ